MQMLTEGVRNLSETQRVEEFAGLELLWSSYFTPYLYTSMRYVDTTLNIPASEEP